LYGGVLPDMTGSSPGQATLFQRVIP